MSGSDDEPSTDGTNGIEGIKGIAAAIPAMLKGYREDPSMSEEDQRHALIDHLTRSPDWPAVQAAAQKMGYHERPEVKELHRVIGGYIDVFSGLMHTMRQAITDYLAPPDERYPLGSPLLDVLFATMTANPIVDSFFGLSTLVGELDEAEIAVKNALRKSVNAHVSYRNDIAHADWSIGWEVADTSERVPDTAYKIKTKAGVPTMSDLGLSTGGIIAQINDLQQLKTLVRSFGAACRSRQRGDGRVSDVLEAIPASPSGGTLVREKSQASEKTAKPMPPTQTELPPARPKRWWTSLPRFLRRHHPGPVDSA
nr:hypothetical protein [Mycolicibacterium komanii]CRL70331.1 hypothetical protein CPGR_01943 [Mycolicibacterium komanii]